MGNVQKKNEEIMDNLETEYDVEDQPCLMHRKTGESFTLHKITSNSQAQVNLVETYIEQYKLCKCESISKLKEVYKVTNNGYCAIEQHFFILFHGRHLRSLHNEFVLRKITQKPFSEKQIQNALSTILLGLRSYHFQFNRQYEHLSLQSVSIDPQHGKMCLKDPWLTSVNSQNKVELIKSNVLIEYPSPEKIQAQRLQQTMVIDQYHSNLFTAAILAFQMQTLHFVDNIYQTRYSIDVREIQNKISAFRNQSLKKGLRTLLLNQADKRDEIFQLWGLSNQDNYYLQKTLCALNIVQQNAKNKQLQIVAKTRSFSSNPIIKQTIIYGDKPSQSNSFQLYQPPIQNVQTRSQRFQQRPVSNTHISYNNVNRFNITNTTNERQFIPKIKTKQVFDPPRSYFKFVANIPQNSQFSSNLPLKRPISTSQYFAETKYPPQLSQRRNTPSPQPLPISKYPPLPLPQMSIKHSPQFIPPPQYNTNQTSVRIPAKDESIPAQRNVMNVRPEIRLTGGMQQDESQQRKLSQQLVSFKNLQVVPSFQPRSHHQMQQKILRSRSLQPYRILEQNRTNHLQYQFKDSFARQNQQTPVDKKQETEKSLIDQLINKANQENKKYVGGQSNQQRHNTINTLVQRNYTPPKVIFNNKTLKTNPQFIEYKNNYGMGIPQMKSIQTIIQENKKNSIVESFRYTPLPQKSHIISGQMSSSITNSSTMNTSQKIIKHKKNEQQLIRVQQYEKQHQLQLSATVVAKQNNQGHTNTPNKPTTYKKYNSTISEVMNEETPQNSQPQAYAESKFVNYNYDGGSKYEGFVSNGMRNGQGKFHYNHGGYYDGNWKDNQMHGWGRLFYESGKIAYEGNWKADDFNGFGKIYNDNPLEFQEAFDYTNFTNLQDKWIFFEGMLANDTKEGRGKLQMSNGETYEGDFHNDKVHGFGRFKTLDGKSIEGIWQDEKLIKVIN